MKIELKNYSEELKKKKEAELLAKLKKEGREKDFAKIKKASETQPTTDKKYK